MIFQIVFFYIQFAITGLQDWLMIPLMISSICIMGLGWLKGGARDPLYKSLNSWGTDEVIASNAFIQCISSSYPSNSPAFCFLIYFILVTINIQNKLMLWIYVHIPVFAGFVLTLTMPIAYFLYKIVADKRRLIILAGKN